MNQSELKKKLQRVVKKVLAFENKIGYSASVVFVSRAKIQELNRVYRKKNRPTDVLSFGQDGADEKYIGEIILCLPYIREQAKEYGVTYLEELTRMTIHGTLHLLGYDHIRAMDRRRMLPRQEKYLSTPGVL